MKPRMRAPDLPPRSIPAALFGRITPQELLPSRRGDWLRTLAVVALATLLCEVMRKHFDLADLIMVYLAGVCFVALRYGLASSLLTVALSIFLFDLIFVPPRWGLAPLNKQHLFTFAVMLVVGVIISRLAAHARAEALLADARTRRAQALNELSGALVAARTREAIDTQVAHAVRGTFGREARLVLLDAADSQQAGALHPDKGDWQFLQLRGSTRVLGSLAVRGLEAEIAAQDRTLLESFANQAALALERAMLEETSIAAQLQAEGERLRSTLLSGISHDVRTPLTTIVGAATALVEQESHLDARARHGLVESILREARRMHGLVSDLLELTRLEEGGVQLAHEWCPVDELAETARQAVLARAKGHTLTVRVPGDAIVWCDPRLVEQALVNLLDNALRHTPAGTAIEVGFTASPGNCALVVADNGPGVAPGTEHDVFQKFFRGRREPAGTGTGLGLAICAAVARLHGGSMSVENRGGAHFSLTLPQPAREGPQP